MKTPHTPVPNRRGRRRTHTAVAIGSLVAAAALVLSGCSASGSSETASSGPVTLTMMNHSRGSEKALNDLAAKYKEQTGVTVTIDTTGPVDYLAKLQSKAQSNKMPDLFTAIAASDMAPYYKAGWAMDLTSELDAGWSKDFIPSVIKLSTFAKTNSLGVPAGTYAAYWDIGAYGFFSNPKTSGIDAEKPPATMTEFIDDLKAKGGNNFSVAASVAPFLLQSYASNYMTDKQIDATFSGKASWKTDAWKKTFQVLVDLSKAGVIASNSLPGGGDDSPAVEKSFFNTRDIAAMFDASWATSVATTTAPDFTDYGTFVPPAAADATQDARALAIPGKGAIVNAKGKHTKEALAFLKWLTAADQQKYFVANAGSIPTNPDLISSSDISPQIAGFAGNLDKVQIVPSPMTADVVSTIVRDSQSLVLGEKTVDDVLSDVQAAQGN